MRKTAVRADAPKAVSDGQALVARLAPIRRAGYAIVNEEIQCGCIRLTVRVGPGVIVVPN